MNEQLRAELKALLESSRDKLQKELESFATEDKNLKGNWDAKPVASEDTDMEEKADEMTEYENLVSLEHSLELRLKDVTLALEKMATEKYGTCENCGKEMAEDRLQAAPEARLCMECNKTK